MIKKANYKSPEFYKILTTVNDVLSYYDLPTISEERGSITESIYNVGKYGSLLMWRTTNYDCPQLMTEGIMDKIYWQLKQVFPQYIADKTITVANPKYSTNKHGKPIASIVIMITELLDNILTKEEFAALKTKDPAVLANCFEKEARMFRRDGDMRDQLTRLEDFAFSMVYEPKLVATPLFKISNLTLLHQTDVVTLEADYSPDFYGTIEDAVYKIEGKSTKAFVDYLAMNTAGFAEYIDSRIKSGSLGGLHGADYCLLVLKSTGEVICFETTNYKNNWLAGRMIWRGIKLLPTKKNKSTKHDKIYTPEIIAKEIISKFSLFGKVLDPFRGGGAFYDNYPSNVEKYWCEIDEGRDFFDFAGKVDWIVSNPPYSIFGDVLKHSMETADNIVYLIPLNKLTSSFTRITELAQFGGIPYIYIIPPKACNFPFGFCTGAVWLKRGYVGPTKIEVKENKKLAPKLK